MSSEDSKLVERNIDQRPCLNPPESTVSAYTKSKSQIKPWIKDEISKLKSYEN